MGNFKILKLEDWGSRGWAKRLVSLLRFIQEYLKYTHSSIDRKWVPCRFENQESSTDSFVSPAVEDEKREEAGQERRGHEMN